jgi:outer membrane protein OmpA-like peptidoglycan-associated protein
VESDIRFDLDNNTLVNNLKKTVNSILQSQLDSQEASRQEIAKKQQRITELEEQLNKQLSDSKQAQLAEEREKQIFKDVKASFTPEEADVYGKDNDVVISVHGFYFPVGSAEISARNFALLNKVASAIRQYPKAKVKISGHTDATGNPETNLKLSIQRAESVSKFLSGVSQLDSGILSSEGFGDTKPIASNKTVAGRTKNRRIEIYIDNPE